MYRSDPIIVGLEKTLLHALYFLSFIYLISYITNSIQKYIAIPFFESG